MSSKTGRSIERRVTEAAEAALEDHQYVSAVDVLFGMGALTQTQMEAWRMGKIPYLEEAVRANLQKISRWMRVFRAWARDRGLIASITIYRSWGKGGKRKLQFSKSGEPSIEKAHMTHYVSPELCRKKVSAPDRGNKKRTKALQPAVRTETEVEAWEYELLADNSTQTQNDFFDDNPF